MWDDLVTSFKTESGLFDLTSYDGNDLKVILDREFNNVFDVKPLTDSEKANMKVEADKKLKPLMQQYNYSLPEGYPKINNVDDFRKIFEQQAKAFDEQEIRTVDKNIETTDIVASEIKKGNFGDLLGKKIIIQKGDSDTPVVSGDGKEAYDELQALIKGDGKVGSITRIASGELAGGRGFKVTTSDGESYTVMTEPLSEGERDLFSVDQQIFEFIQNPVNIGSGEELFSPYLNDEGFEVSMQPKKVYRYGQQQQLVDVRLYTRNSEGQRIRVDNGVEELDLNQFIQLSEHQKKEWYKNHYLSNSLQNKSNPNQ